MLAAQVISIPRNLLHFLRATGSQRCKNFDDSSDRIKLNTEVKDEASDDNHCFELHINRHSMLF